MHTLIRPSRLILALTLAASCLASGAETPAPSPSVTETIAKEVVKQTDKALEQAAAPVTNQSTELAKTGNEALRFILTKAKEYTGKVEDGIGKAVDVAQREIGPTVEQFLRWRLWRHGIYAFSTLFGYLLILGAYAWFWRYSKTWHDDFDQVCGRLVGTVVAGLMISISFSTTCLPNLLSFIQILVAPRIYLIESVSQLIGR